jgi:hypothetical protein
MQHQGTLAVSGHVFCVRRKRGPQFYAKYRIGSKQIQRRLGPAWSEPGHPPPGYLTRKTAEAELAAILTDARRGAVPHSTGSGVTVRQAAEEWLRHCEWERGAKASTLSEYGSVVRAHIVPRFGDEANEAVTARQVEVWAAERHELSDFFRRYAVKLDGVRRLHERIGDLGGSGSQNATGSRKGARLNSIGIAGMDWIERVRISSWIH